MKKGMQWLVVAALLVGVGSANAFIYNKDNSLLWTGAVDNNWNVDGNWDNLQGPDYGVPGDDTNEYSYALIESGTVDVTPASAPPYGVGRAYVGGTGAGATLNIGADILFERFLISWLADESATINHSAGTMDVVYSDLGSVQFMIGKAGTGQLNITGGTVQGTRVRIASDTGSTGTLEISGDGAFVASEDLTMREGTGTLVVNGSAAAVTVDAFTVISGHGHTLKVGLDAGGVAPINVVGDVAGNGDNYDGAALNDLAIVVDDLPGFNGAAGDSYDIFSSATSITTNGLTVTSNIEGVEFAVAIVADGGNEVLRLTIVPPLEFELSGTKFVPTGFQLQWHGVVGRSYRLDVSTDLTASPAFTVLQSGIPGTAGLTEFIDTGATGRAQSFYRVVEE